MLPAAEDQPEQTPADPLGELLPAQTQEEYEPVAGLMDKLVNIPLKVIRQGTSAAPRVADDVAARAAQEVVQGAAVAAERRTSQKKLNIF